MSSMPNLSNCVLRHPERWAGLTDETRRIELVISTAPEEVKDKCKTLCESVLKTMLVSSSVKTEPECESADMNALKTWSCELLELSESDAKIVKAEVTYLYEGRNRDGIGGHGRSLQRQREIRDEVDERENERYLSVCDSLLADLIYRFERRFPVTAKNARNKDFDESLDSMHGPFDILTETYSASEIVYGLSPDIYQAALNEYLQEE